MWKYSPYITRNGQKIYAKWYGKKVFRFWVDEETTEESPEKQSEK